MEITAAMDIDIERMAEGMREAIKALGGHMRELCERTVGFAKQDSPYDTGTNRKSVTGEYSDGQSTGGAAGNEMTAVGVLNLVGGDMGGAVYGQSGYSGFLEVGTEKMAARPHIFPGFERAVNETKAALEGSL